ncbi:unnamed protein product [Effrenium voratum]|nr:unnamed protein product [Effrenium voratum]
MGTPAEPAEGHASRCEELALVASSPSPQPSASVLRLPVIRGVAPRKAARAQLAITVTTEVEDVELAVELAEGEAQDEGGFPAPLPCGVATTRRFCGKDVLGRLCVAGVPPVPFGVQVEAGRSFVATEVRRRTLALGAEELGLGSGMGATGRGTAVDMSISEGPQAVLTVNIRRAKKKELTKLAQQQALQTAMERGRYSSLLAQIARAKTRKVEAAMIEQANRVLKTLQPKEGSFMTHKELAHLMKWRRVTCPDGAAEASVPCELDEACPCNAGSAQPGELCLVMNDAVAVALKDVAPSHMPADQWLFKALVQAALHAPEGCVWKSGGKFLLSNEERNQSANAIVGVLERNNTESEAGKGVRALVSFTEQEYGYRVTAVQLNFHPNHKSSHKQHRDIYGAGQKGGINCTCSFMKCTGTVCYSLGSSRQVLCETITDARSKYQTCGEECQGMKTYKWMHSGSAMHFNAPWNNNHTHGIPPLDEPCGPRISIALLCA